MRSERRYISKSDLVADALRDMIMGGELPPGGFLRQRELAEQFGVSATPVREALRRLESEGLIVFDTHRGVTVADPGIEEIEEDYRILSALEALAGRLAVDKITAEDLEEIDSLHGQLARPDLPEERRKELNRQFHFRVYECAHSPTLLLLMRLLWRSFPNGPQAGRPFEESVRQHTRLIGALRDRDPEEVVAVIEDHALGSIEYLRRNPRVQSPAGERRSSGRRRFDGEL